MACDGCGRRSQISRVAVDGFGGISDDEVEYFAEDDFVKGSASGVSAGGINAGNVGKINQHNNSLARRSGQGLEGVNKVGDTSSPNRVGGNSSALGPTGAPAASNVNFSCPHCHH